MKMDKLLALYPQAQKKLSSIRSGYPFFCNWWCFYLDQTRFIISTRNQPFESVIPCNQRSKNTHGITIFLKMLLVFKKKLSFDPASRRIKRRILKKEWQDTILELFRYSADFFLYRHRCALSRTNKPWLSWCYWNQRYFLSLDADFDTTTSVFVGSFHSPGTDLVPLFAEERKIFNRAKQSLYSQPYFSMQDVALHYYTKDTVKDSKLIKSYIELIKQNEMEVIIQELWNELGNVSSAAKHCFFIVIL